jgi:membrane fusion protein (multidrug efflux system)
MSRFIPFAALSMLCLSLVACDQAVSDESAAAAAPAPVMVTTVTIQTEDIPVRFEYVGQVDASLEVDIRSQVTGIVEKRHFREGGRVKANQLLFSLDARPFEASHKQALAAIEIARAQKISAEAQLKKAKRELTRVTPLASQKLLGQNQQDDAASAVDVAEAQLAVAEAAIHQAQANLLTAEINLDYTRIRSPVDGIAGRAQVNRGALVQAGAGEALTTIVQTRPAFVDFGMPQNERLRMRREIGNGKLRLPQSGFEVDLLDAQGKASGYAGTLDFEDYKVDNRTGTFAMRASLPNDDELLSPGQFVRVLLKGATRTGAMAIPQRAVLDGPGGKYVYVVAPGQGGMQIAAQKQVVPGEWVSLGEGRDNYWLIREGLAPGDEVIVDGVARIFFPGMPVKVDNTPATQPAQ